MNSLTLHWTRSFNLLMITLWLREQYSISLPSRLLSGRFALAIQYLFNDYTVFVVRNTKSFEMVSSLVHDRKISGHSIPRLHFIVCARMHVYLNVESL